MNSLAVALVGGNNLFRQGLVRMLPEDFQVVAQETGFDSGTVGRLEAGLPGLILLDAEIDAARRIIGTLKMALPAAKIVYLTDGCDGERLRTIFDAGADGYLTLDRSVEALAQALRLVALGEKVFPSDVAALMEGGASDSVRSPLGISPRETQILRFVMAGETNKSIGRHLAITEATVKIHLKSLLRKIAASNRTQAAVWGMNNGLSARSAP